MGCEPLGRYNFERAECRRRFGFPRPAEALELLGQRKGAPLLGEACIVLADLCDPWAAPKAKKRPAHKVARDSLRAESVVRDSS